MKRNIRKELIQLSRKIKNGFKPMDGMKVVLDNEERFVLVFDYEDGYDDSDLRNPSYIPHDDYPDYLLNYSIRMYDESYCDNCEMPYAYGDDTNGYDGGMTFSKNTKSIEWVNVLSNMLKILEQEYKERLNGKIASDSNMQRYIMEFVYGK